MEPKELLHRLGISANRIKLFKREGIFIPENPPEKNRKTEYTEADVQKLTEIVRWTSSGLTCSDIRKVQKQEAGLEEVILNRKQLLEADIKRKKSILKKLERFLIEIKDNE